MRNLQRSGRIKSAVTEAHDLIREITRTHVRTGSKKLSVTVRDDVHNWIQLHEQQWLNETLAKLNISVEFKVNPASFDHLQDPAYMVRAH